MNDSLWGRCGSCGALVSATADEQPTVVVGRRTGRVLKAAKPKASLLSDTASCEVCAQRTARQELRAWAREELRVPQSRPLTVMRLVGETLHILRPVVHLAVGAKLGVRGWPAWAVSLVMEVGSWVLFRQERGNMTESEQQEWSHRRFYLLANLFRSPFYDRFVRTRLHLILHVLRAYVPVFGFVVGKRRKRKQQNKKKKRRRRRTRRKKTTEGRRRRVNLARQGLPRVMAISHS